ncbi:MAG TPA: SgcJ/EcaC family oxidoreductase [Gemmatimonadota bacterium]|nr:SgcJ/EcaC family oxidoreductase [Gemmatimonadota bacterium]
MRTGRWITMALLPVGVFLQTAVVSGQDEWDEIKELGARFVAMVEADDLEGIVGLYAEDARFMPPNAPAAYGRDAIREAWRPLLDLPSLTFEPVTIVVADSREQAVDIGEYRAEIPLPGGTTISDVGKYMVVWLEEDGEWRIFADIFNSDLPLE